MVQPSMLSGFTLQNWKTVVREFHDIRVVRNLEIEFVPASEQISSMDHAPILCALEVWCTDQQEIAKK